MYRHLFWILSIMAICFAFSQPDYSMAQNGQALFESFGCGDCHKPDKKTIGPSLTAIATAYQDSEQLAAFLAGASQPLLSKRLAKTMQDYMPRLAVLTPEEQLALADFVFQPQ